MNCIVRGVTKSRTQLSDFHSLPSLREAESLTFQRKIKKIKNRKRRMQRISKKPKRENKEKA